MLNLSTNLKNAVIDGKVCRYARLDLTNGTTVALTSHDSALIVGGVVYQPVPDLEPTSMLQSNDGTIDNQRVFSSWFGNYVNITSLFGGDYDSAGIEVGWIAWDINPLERIVLFSGVVGDITWTDQGMSMEAISELKKLEKNIARTYTANDPYSFGDPEWGLAEGPYTFTGTVNTVLTPRYKFTMTGDAASQPDQYFSYGKITWTTGLNAGRESEVRIHLSSNNSLELYVPTGYNISNGDQFTALAGYDGSFDQAKTKFNNAVNFGGFPHIKPPKTE